MFYDDGYSFIGSERQAKAKNYALSPVISPTSFFSTYPKSLYSSEEDVNEYERKVVWARHPWTTLNGGIEISPVSASRSTVRSTPILISLP